MIVVFLSALLLLHLC